MFVFSTSHVSSRGSAITTASEVEERRVQELSCEINHGVSLESIKEDTEGRSFSFDTHNSGHHQADCVYAGVGKEGV
ncbi:hypothetical protein SADUNF_Sadunf16G0010100 [Salix dunnii]|uniref:Uncharacterized protein n=1 Tax=Salix dunnii TaxID=1413687 RepID=A0A835MFB7_9ROSI|nr:hypothetical protein SADUNF_Sadunf16G0010100 [Salix dunnii]